MPEKEIAMRRSKGYKIVMLLLLLLLALGGALLWFGVTHGEDTDLRFIKRLTALCPAGQTRLL